MARPMMKLGEWGNIATTGYRYDDDGKRHMIEKGARKAEVWRARAKVRDLDGKVRDVETWGQTEASARRELTERLRERVQPAAAHAVVKASTKVKDVARVWLDELAESGRSVNTRKVYASVCNRHVIGTEATPAPLANLTVREVTVGGVERFLAGVAKTSGQGAARTTRTVLRGVLDLATKHDAIQHNPVRSAGPINVRTTKTRTRDTGRAFTADEQAAVLAFAATDPTSQRRDLADLLAFLAGTGARIGEVCALRWSALGRGHGQARSGRGARDRQGTARAGGGEVGHQHPDDPTARRSGGPADGAADGRCAERVGRGVHLAAWSPARPEQHVQRRQRAADRRRPPVGDRPHLPAHRGHRAGPGRAVGPGDRQPPGTQAGEHDPGRLHEPSHCLRPSGGAAVRRVVAASKGGCFRGINSPARKRVEPLIHISAGQRLGLAPPIGLEPITLRIDLGPLARAG